MERDRDQRTDELRGPARDASASAPGTSAARAERRVLQLVLLATVGIFLARLPTIPWRVFDPDELQHAHASWCVWRGLLPYRDFFEHHTPWYYYFLAPFFHGFDVAGSFESAKRFLSFGRGLSLALTALTVLLVARLGGRRDRRLGPLAGLLLAGQPVFLQKTLEIRPDVLALPFYIGGLLCLVRGLALGAGAMNRAPTTDSPRVATGAPNSAPTTTGGCGGAIHRALRGGRRGAIHRALRGAPFRHPLSLFLGGGLCLGAAIMCTQKMLFVLPGILAGLGLWLLVAGRGGETGQPRLRYRSLLVAVFLVGLAIPGALTLAAFAWHGAGSAFITNNFLLNSRWTHVAQEQLRRVLGGSWPVALLALLGATVSVYRWLRSQPREHGELLLLCILLGLIAGILVVPVAHRQYYLMAIPLLCLFGAKGLLQLVERARARARPLVLGLATLALLVLPVLDVVDSYTQHNDRQLARLRFVFDETGPTDAVMDGWNGTGVFRPHALHHYFLHDESVAMLTPAQVDAYLDGLECGTIRPRLIALDDHLVALGSRFVRFLEAHYESTDGFFYLRKEDAR